MRRRTPVAVLVVAAAAALAVRGCGEPAPAAPNVLLVVVDTLRQDRLGVYGYDRHPTSPTLDAFARDEAVVVEGLTAVSSWTLPSMATLFTGLGPARHGVMRLSGEAGSLLEPRTLAQELRRAGYATGCVQGNFLLRRSWGAQLDRGFDSYDDSVIGPEAHRGSTAAEVASRGLAWIEGRPAGQPWFLALQFFDPHVAYEDHAEYAFEDPDYRGWVVGGLGGKELRDQLDRVGPADRRQLDAFYDEEVRAVDDALGRVLAALRARPDWQDTIVVFTADHGEELAERGWIGHTRTLHFEQIDLPLVVRLPGAAAAGERRRGRIGQAGLYATILELAGVEVPPGRQASFAAWLRGRAAAPAAPVTAEVDFVPALEENSAKRTRLRSVVRGDLKVVHDLEDRSWRLYDLGGDPLERDDLSGEVGRAAEFAELREWLLGQEWWEAD